MAIYFSGQGKVFSSDRDVNGNFTAFAFLGNVPEFKVMPKIDFFEHVEAQSGSRFLDARAVKKTAVSVELTVEEFTAANLVKVLYGDSVVDPGTSVTGETAPTGLQVNDYLRLKNGDVSAVVVKDSAGVPATLVAGTDYVIESAAHGMLQILNLGTYVQPFKVNYTYAGQTRVRALTTSVKERWLRFEGINTADPALGKWLVELYRVQLDPLKDLNAISDNMEKLVLSGVALYDSTKALDATLGGWGKMVIL